MKQFLLHRWFLLVLVGVIVLGASLAAPLAAFFALLPRSWESVLIAAMMFLMALPLDAGAIGRALRRPAATLLGVGVSFVIAPAVAWTIAQGLAHLSRD